MGTWLWLALKFLTPLDYTNPPPLAINNDRPLTRPVLVQHLYTINIINGFCWKRLHVKRTDISKGVRWLSLKRGITFQITCKHLLLLIVSVHKRLGTPGLNCNTPVQIL